MAREWSKTIHPHGIPIISLIPLFGYLSAGGSDLFAMAAMTLVGFLGHAAALTQNDYVDTELDRQCPGLVERPMVGRTISRKALSIASLVFTTSAVIAGLALLPEVRAMMVLAALVAAGTSYNLLSKRVPFMELPCGLWAFLFCIWGAMFAGVALTGLVYATGILWALELIFLIVVMGGTKDIKHDLGAGAKTTMAISGLAVRDGKLHVSRAFMAYTVAIMASQFAVILYALSLADTKYWYILYPALLLVGGLYVRSVVRLLGVGRFDRNEVVARGSASVILSYALIPLTLVAFDPWFLGVLLFTGIWWNSTNYILYKRTTYPSIL